MFKPTVVALLGALALPAAWGQSIISARAGLIHHAEGTVLVDGQPLDTAFAQFPELKIGQTLSVEDGRAEILLLPGSVLRLAEDSSVKLLANKLTDTRVEVLTGAALVEATYLDSDHRLNLSMAGRELNVAKAGLYYMNAQDGHVRVYTGKMELATAGRPVNVTKGRMLDTASGETAKFNTKSKDDLYLWSQSRSTLLAQANMSAARTIQRNGYASAYGRNGLRNIWVFDPWLGVYTFLPGGGIVMSPFGYSLYSPATIWIAYAPNYGAGSSSGGSNSSSGWAGISSDSYSAAASAPSAGVPVRADSGGGSVSSAPAASAPAAAPASTGSRGR